MQIYLRRLLIGLSCLLLACCTPSPFTPPISDPRAAQETTVPDKSVPSHGAREANEVRFHDAGKTGFGEWQAEVTVSPKSWHPGIPLAVQARLTVSETYLQALEAQQIKPDGFVLLLTAERTFDADGILRLPSDERMSTLLTPTGLAIEGGVQGAVTKRFGYGFRTPVDELVAVPIIRTQKIAPMRQATVNIATRLPDDLPPGIYRLRLDYGVTVKRRYYTMNATAFARRGFPKGPCDTETYSPPFPASARHVSGHRVDALKIRPRIPWVLLANYNSNGYRGVVADEDKPHFSLSNRNIIPDEVILPRYNENNPKNSLAYNLEPQFPTDTIDPRQNIPWDFTKGELTVQIIQPDGKVVRLGRRPFVGKTGNGPSTMAKEFMQWKPPMYGRYTVKATGWTEDLWGNRYEGGGTYRFWIAKRMTLATATFQGQPYQVGNRYGRDIGFAPAVPADVEVNAKLFVNSDPKNVRAISYNGKASRGGVFGAPQGMKPLPFDAPGEYQAQVLAKYTDVDGHLWVSSMRHAGVVYPEDTPIVAHGKMLKVKDKLLERGETNFEGWHDLQTDELKLEHINFPYNAYDVLLIASEQSGANKIEPMLTWRNKVNPRPYDPKIQGIGLTNLRIQTSNGYSPHLFPEYITEWMYFYAGAPRPGFMGRFLVGENGIRAPYWPTSKTNFGGQINATRNGDAPGDIYRLLGGLVIRRNAQPPLYAGYMANAFILPKGSRNNRVIAPGSEDIVGATGEKARLFLAMNARPGMVYETGTAFVPAIQIDPMVPARITFTLSYPDGRQVVAQGAGDATGSFAGKDRWTLDVPGVYRYKIVAEWNGCRAVVPGLPRDGGEIYVMEKDLPPDAGGLVFNLPQTLRFNPEKGRKITGMSTAKTINYAAVIPGAVLLQGTLLTENGEFEYNFDPAALNRIASTYDITNNVTGKPEIGDVVHLTFFSEEKAPGGQAYHSFVRLIIRGNTIHYTR